MATDPDPPLVDTADLNVRLEDDLDIDFALQIVLGASSVVRSFTRQKLHRVVDDEVRLYGGGGDSLFLPEVPVVLPLGVITLDGVEVDPDSLLVDERGGIVRFARRTYGRWTHEAPVVATYTHGYEPMHETVRTVTLNVGARAAESSAGSASEQIGDHQVATAGGVTIGWGGIYLTGKEMDMLRPFRVRR